jgi:predicted RNA binding protein YcfA (HicA-like mRNA interferase family)
MKPLSYRKIFKILEKNGFEISRQKGSHVIFKHREKNIIVPVPLHNKNKPLPIGTFLAIVKQSKIPKEDFKI